MNLELKQPVLVVDINTAARHHVVRELRQMALPVVEAENRDQCLTLIQKHSPVLMILSATLPNAFELTAELKTMFGLPVLLLSAHEDRLIECAFTAGADDWLVEMPPAALLRKRVQQMIEPQTSSQIRAQQQLEKTLYYIAQGSWGLGSEDFLRALTIYLAKALNAAYTFVAELTSDGLSAETIAMYAHGEIVSNFSYELRDTPCENVMAKKLSYYERDVQKLFPRDVSLQEYGAESYIGIPLWSTSSKPIGVLGMMDTKPLEDVSLASSMLQLVAVRAARELERTRSDRALREAEQFARATLDGLTDHIAILDETGVILAVNDAWRSFGVTNGGTLESTNEGANYLEVCDNAAKAGYEDAGLMAKAIREVLNGSQKRYEVEYACHAPEEQRWFVVQVTRFPGNGALRAIVSHHNITIRKQFEEALRDSEARYQSVILAMAEGVVLHHVNAANSTANASAERILGLTVAQLGNREPFPANWYTIHEDGSPFPVNVHPTNVTLQTGEPQHEIIMGVHKPNGTLTWISVNTQPLVYEGASKPYAAVASFTDITARKNAEDALRLREERYRLISELISDYAFAFYVHEDGSLEWEWNTDSFQLITGYTPEIVEGKARQLYHPEDRERVNQDIEEVIKFKRPNVGEYRIITAHGETKWVQVYRQPTLNAQGRVVHMYAVTCDITSEKQAEQALIEQKRLEAILHKEREVNNFRTNLMRTLSHEFRTPLAIISTACDILEHYMDRATPQQRAEKISNIRTQLDRLVEMMDDISIVSQTGSQRTVARLALVDIEDVCQRSVEEVSHSMGARHLMNFVSEGNVGNAMVDKRMLQRILSNLLTNAVKYSPPSSTISTRLSRDEKDLIIEVQDQGIGLSDQDQHYVFEPFYRASSVNNIVGTGLGLSIVRECASVMHGSVSVKSILGVGSTFTVRLPYNV